jgi:hypothetical protein
MPTVTLQPITSDNMLECTGLRPSAEQQKRGYVAENVFSLAQAYVEPWWTPLAPNCLTDIYQLEGQGLCFFVGWCGPAL